VFDNETFCNEFAEICGTTEYFCKMNFEKKNRA